MTAPFAAWLSTTNAVTAGFLAAGRIPGLINMAGGLPAPQTYPAEDLARIAAQVIRDRPAEVLGYGPIEGLPDLRVMLARRYSAPGLSLGPENVLVTASGMQGLDLLGKVLLDAGATVVTQTPTYLGALDAWRPRGPRYRRLDYAVPDLRDAAFAYAVPNYSNPTGALVGLEDRQRLVDAAADCWLVEDDPYGTLHYDAAPLPRLLSLAQGKAPVVYLGTLSKEITPGLRVGWVIAPPRMIAALAMAKQGTDLCTSGLTQAMTLVALEEGLPEKIGPGIRALYRERRDALVAAMARHLAGAFHWQVPVGGMFVWARTALDTDRLLPLALEEGVSVTPSSVFDPEGADRGGIRINFTLNPPEKLEEGVRRLARAVERLEAMR